MEAMRPYRRPRGRTGNDDGELPPESVRRAANFTVLP